MSVDPLADIYPGLSPYNYCFNNPLNDTDPDGRKVEFGDEELKKKHEDFYSQKDEDGNYVNKEYRSQYDQLNASDILYKVVNADLSSKDNGGPEVLGNTSTKDGNSILFSIDMKRGATIGGELSHEFQHGVQFENGLWWFSREDEKSPWQSQNMSIDLEYDAYASQQNKGGWWKDSDLKYNRNKIRKAYDKLPEHSNEKPFYSNERNVLRSNKSFMVLPKKHEE